MAEQKKSNRFPSEHTSITVSKTSSDIHGNQVTSRTYCSIIKRGQHVVEGTEPTNSQQKSDKKDSSNKPSSMKTPRKRRGKKFTQMFLFPASK